MKPADHERALSDARALAPCAPRLENGTTTNLARAYLESRAEAERLRDELEVAEKEGERLQCLPRSEAARVWAARYAEENDLSGNVETFRLDLGRAFEAGRAEVERLTRERDEAEARTVAAIVAWLDDPLRPERPRPPALARAIEAGGWRRHLVAERASKTETDAELHREECGACLCPCCTRVEQAAGLLPKDTERTLANVCRVAGLTVEAARHLADVPESPSPHEPYRRDFTTLFGAEVAEKLINPPPAPSTYDPDPSVQALRASRPALAPHLPLPPEILADALQDRIHHDEDRARPARTAKALLEPAHQGKVEDLKPCYVERSCPKCGGDCDRIEVDIGVGVQCGPWQCMSCAWSQDGEEEWPLLCEDSCDLMDEMRYRVLRDYERPQEGKRVRRCRRMKASAFLGTTIDAEALAEQYNEHIGDGGPCFAGEHFANWDDEIVTATAGADEALREWADKWLDVRAWEVEPNPPETSGPGEAPPEYHMDKNEQAAVDAALWDSVTSGPSTPRPTLPESPDEARERRERWARKRSAAKGNYPNVHDLVDAMTWEAAHHAGIAYGRAQALTPEQRRDLAAMEALRRSTNEVIAMSTGEGWRVQSINRAKACETVAHLDDPADAILLALGYTGEGDADAG
jgi:hypothetical protein